MSARAVNGPTHSERQWRSGLGTVPRAASTSLLTYRLARAAGQRKSALRARVLGGLRRALGHDSASLVNSSLALPLLPLALPHPLAHQVHGKLAEVGQELDQGLHSSSGSQAAGTSGPFHSSRMA